MTMREELLHPRVDTTSAARILNLLLGAWLFVSAFAWDHLAAQRANAWILGALCAFFAIIATAVPAVRYLNTLLAVWLFVSVWALPHHSLATQWNDALVAIAVLVISLVPSVGEGGGTPHHVPA